MSTTDDMPTRRRVLEQGLVAAGGASILAAGAAGPVEAKPKRRRRRRPRRRSSPGVRWVCETLTLDVAMLGDSLRFVPVPPTSNLDPQDNRGHPYFGEMAIYRVGTIPRGDGFDPRSKPDIGRLFEHGATVEVLPDRLNPLLTVERRFVFGAIGNRQPFPRDQIATSGLAFVHHPDLSPEPVNDPPSAHAVVGGTGKYAGATGEAFFTFLGRNTTRTIEPTGTFDEALGHTPQNYRVELHFLVPRH